MGPRTPRRETLLRRTAHGQRIYSRHPGLQIPYRGDGALTPLTPGSAALTDAEIARLESLLDALPAPLQPLDVSALDGFLCGVLLQPHRVPAGGWLTLVFDIEGRPAPAGMAAQELQTLVLRRHAELERAIDRRQWFDPWIYQLEDDAPAAECMLPWVAGFAAAQDAFGDLLALDDPELIEPLALLYMHFDPADLEDADALQAVIDTLEPPSDLGEAVQDTVRAVMLIADVTLPRGKAAAPKARARRPRR